MPAGVSEDGVNNSKRNSNHPRQADDNTLMVEREEELKSLLMKVKRRVKRLA